MIQSARRTPPSLHLAAAVAFALVAAGCSTARTETGSESSPECLRCHGAPPASGAHQAHLAFLDVDTLAYGDEWRTDDLDPSGAQGSYTFGCGTCHPKDEARHQNGRVDVELSPTDGVAGGLRALNGAAAAFDPASQSCSGVYCHSSGQATPAFAASPGWTSGASLGCGGCHGNPPTYASGGAGGAANSHIFLNQSGYEAGHFAGLPGNPPTHQSRHGGPSSFGDASRSAPITCQACHADTVDPANVAPGGFFYLDTSINSELPGGDQSRKTTTTWRDTQCVTCHTGQAGAPPSGTGKVRPVVHVNGTREVAFDRRAGVPADYFTDLATGAPSRPYFMSDARFLIPPTLPPGAGFDPAAPNFPDTATLSYELSAAAYQPATRTCSSVACHLGHDVTWGANTFATATPNCSGCHPMP